MTPPRNSDESNGKSGRRDELLEIAAGLFADRGVRATTVRDIADAAGILSGSLYHHFDSKESMVDEIPAPVPRRTLRKIPRDRRGGVGQSRDARSTGRDVVRGHRRLTFGCGDLPGRGQAPRRERALRLPGRAQHRIPGPVGRRPRSRRRGRDLPLRHRRRIGLPLHARHRVGRGSLVPPGWIPLGARRRGSISRDRARRALRSGHNFRRYC